MPTFVSFFMAVAFLTRLPTPRVPIHDMTAVVAGAMRWYPPVGLLLGLLAALPGLCFAPELRGLLYVALLVWLTRGLHWDGLADLCDANGACGTVSPDDPEALSQRFGEVLKDSRLGAFGAMGLVLGLGGQALLATDAPLSVLLLAPVVGRTLPGLMHKFAPTRANSTLAKMLGLGLPWPWVLAHLGLGLAAALWLLGPVRAALLSAGLALLVWRLCRLARHTGGINGDFFGAGIVCGEVATLLAARLVFP